jgi:hypothetical protein
VLAIQTVMPAGYTILLLSAKQSRENQCNEASCLKKKKCIRRAQRYLSALKCGEVPLQIEFTTFAAKKPQPLCETWIEKGIGEKGIVATGL